MPELRQDPVTGSWTVVATERAKRPDSFTEQGENEKAVCPFCEGNEALTPPEVLSYRAPGTKPNTPGWRIRVVPNKFAAFIPDGESKIQTDGLFRSRQAYGAHEVVVHSPDHHKGLAQQTEGEVQEVLRAYRDRYLALREKEYVTYILIIVNHGKAAGASLEHPHSQIFAAPFLPPRPAQEVTGAEAYMAGHGRCVFCDIIQAERRAGTRLLSETGSFIAFSPYAARLPFEAWIIPKGHAAFFEAITDEDRKDLAGMLRLMLLKLYNGLNDPPYNLYLHTAPCRGTVDSNYHWHFALFPKLTVLAGFELGSGATINITRPEEAAEFLRNVTI